MKYIVAILAMLFAFSQPAGAGINKDPHNFQQVIDDFSYPGTEFVVKWEQCYTLNAYYNPKTRAIVMCKELLESLTPGAVRFVLAHELSHMLIHQLDIPITGSEEGAADELAATIFTLTNRSTDTMEMAGYFFWRSIPESPADDHFGDLRRASNLFCLAQGAYGKESTPCTLYWRRAVANWNRLLGVQ